VRLEGNDAFWEIEEVVEGANVTRKAIEMGLERGSNNWQGVKFPDDRRRTWIRHSTMATKYQAMLEQKYCDGMNPVDWKKMQEMRGSLIGGWMNEATLEDKLEDACEENWQGYRKRYETKVNTADARKREKQIKCLCRSAAVMDTLVDWIASKGLKSSNKQVYETVAKWLEQNRNRYFYYKYVPMNWLRLREKVSLMESEDLASWDVITLPRSGNENKVKYTDDVKKEMRGLVLRMMLNGAGMSDEMMARKLTYFYMMHGENVPSTSTIKRIMNETQVKLMASQKRYGDNKAGKQKYRQSTPLERAQFAGDCWEADGTRVQLQGFEVDGVRRTLFIVAIRDVMSGMYVGWSYGLSENSDLYWEALRMAVTVTGYIPYELRVDGFRFDDKVTNLFEKMKKYGMKLTITRTSTGKANAERSFGTLQSVFESEHKGWVGEGILSGDQNSRPTAEYLTKTAKKLKEEGWNWEKAWQEHNSIMMAYNATKFSAYSKKLKGVQKSPIELHNESTKPAVKTVDFWDVPTLFWAEAIRPLRYFQITFTKRGIGDIVFDMNSDEYLDIHKKYNSVMVRWDADVLEEIMIFDPKTDAYLTTVKAFKRIQLYGENAEFDRNTEYKEKAKALKKKVKEMTEKTLDGSERVLDESALSLGAMVSKEIKENAETAAMEEYLMNRPPQSSTVLKTTKKTKTKVLKDVKAITAPVPVKESESAEIDHFDFIMNQL